MRVWVTLVESSAYTVWYVCVAVVQATCEPVDPLKARPGMPSSDASVAAPTVPEISVVSPRFAALGCQRLTPTYNCVTKTLEKNKK